MADVAVPLPHLGVSVEEATVLAWLREPGDAVRVGDVLCEVATDKVDTEIASPVDGVLAEHAAAVGDTVAVGAPLCRVAVGGDAGGDARPAADLAPTTAVTAAAAAAAPAKFDPVLAAERVVATAAAGRDGGRVSSPVARRLAAEHGVDLAAVNGSGRLGRITKADVLAAVPSPSPTPAAVTGTADATLPRGYDDVPHTIVVTTRRRRLTAEHMLRSRQTAAHMTTEAEVDLSAALRARQTLNAAAGATGDVRLSPLALVARVACATLLDFPDLNATFQGERHVRWGQVNLGIAVDTPEGLIVPVIRGCERLTAPGIAAAIADLAARARGGGLTPDDLRAGTFTLSNPGSVGGFSAMAIINQPQVAILGTPVIVRRPVVVRDEHGAEAIGIRPMLTLTLTFDHRAVDGAEATRCVVAMKDRLEAWGVSDYA